MNAERVINPYATSDALDIAALSVPERRLLEFYLKYRHTCPARGRLLSQYAPSWGLMACSFAILLGVMYVMFGTASTIPALVFVGGAWMGAMLRDIGHCRRVVHYWPLHQRVLDWSAIEEILIESSSSKPLE